MTTDNHHDLSTIQPLPKAKILIGITGGIACYKIAFLVRLLIKNGADVRVMMTKAACEFITPLTMQALSTHQVHTELLDESGKFNNEATFNFVKKYIEQFEKLIKDNPKD